MFDLSFQGVVIGTANIANLILVPGENVVATAVHYEPTGSAQPVGQLLLENFVQRIVSTTTILGTTSTTPIESLQQALSTIRLVTDIPPLEQNLIPSARLELPLDVSTTGIGNTYATLVDPFTAAINIDGLIATAIYPIGNIDIGVINQPSLNPALHVDGHTSAELPALPLQLNLDPRVLSRLILAVANNQSVSLGPLTDRLKCVGCSEARLLMLRQLRHRSLGRADRQLLAHHDDGQPGHHPRQHGLHERSAVRRLRRRPHRVPQPARHPADPVAGLARRLRHASQLQPV